MNLSILNEIPPLSDKDCFHVVERYKTEFTFPLHQHREFEINFIEHGKGLKRTIGDSIEYVEDYDLILISGERLEHVWEQGNCVSPVIREITIQFSRTCCHPACWKTSSIPSGRCWSKRNTGGLPHRDDYEGLQSDRHHCQEDKGFEQFLRLLKLIHELSVSENSRSLASSSFAHAERNTESRRVCKVKDYINQHYTRELSLSNLSQMVGMSPVAFSRFQTAYRKNPF